MIKVLIVDDERLVRIGIRSSIQWEDYGFTVVGEACNGEEALMKIQTLHPDLILTDIRMPKMDGIELLQELERRGLAIETIILSCYNEFEIVRSAMKYGANDYLLKLSMSDEELLEVLKRSQQRILHNREQSGNSSAFGEDDLREKFTKLVLNPDTPFSEPANLIQRLHISLDTENMALMILSVDRLFDKNHISYYTLNRQTTALLNNLLHDDLINQKWGDAFILDQLRGHFLLCLNSGIDLNATAVEIQQKIREYFNLTLSICIMDYNFYKKHFFSYVQQALSILQDEKFLFGRGYIFNLDSYSTPELSQVSPISVPEALGEVRGVADLNKLTGAVQRLNELMSAQKINKSTCLSLFTEIFYKIADITYTYGGSIEGLNQNCGISLLKSLQQLEFLGDSENWFKIYIQLISDYLIICKNNWKRGEIFQAIDYINNNYHLPISSQKVAKIVGISDAYFSTLFKKEIGCSFTEYLTDLRMKKAIQLLEDQTIYIYEVGGYVGYSDSNYFGKVFKKYTGLSPEAYRKSRSE